MIRTVHTALFTALLAAGAAGAITAGSLPAETAPDRRAADLCERAAWPNIPAACLVNARTSELRFVSADRPIEDFAILDRIAAAFD